MTLGWIEVKLSRAETVEDLRFVLDDIVTYLKEQKED